MKRIYNALIKSRRLHEVYPHATRMQIFKWRIHEIFKFTFRMGTVAGMVYAAFVAGAYLNPVTTYATQEKIVEVDTFSQKIEALKNKVVDEIQSCESGGYKESDGILIFDTNNKASIGTMQFQTATVQYYYKYFYGTELTKKEAVILALDDAKAKDLAKRVMFETKNMASKDWYNCSQRFNSDTQIKLIKELTK